ncbi:MAG TPA: hypothetical protein VMF67_01095 [Rhizomicrobium sp.]|nr:hypothetical protein [Rhizomicrobium sp.]
MDAILVGCLYDNSIRGAGITRNSSEANLIASPPPRAVPPILPPQDGFLLLDQRPLWY